MKKYLILLISLSLFVFVIVIIGVAQTRDEFKQRYGSPDSKGHYIVRPNIGLLVKYEKSRSPSEMVIEPLDSNTTSVLSVEKENSNKVMPSDIAEGVFDELVPIAKRGKKGNTGIAEFGCTSSEYTEYEQVTTNIIKRCEQQGKGTYSITVRWKK